MANDDDLPDALPPEAPMPEVRKRRSPKPHARVSLDDWESSELAKAIAPYVRRMPDEEGNLPRRPSEGTSELLDPAMTMVELCEKLAPTLPFPITANNVEGVTTRFYGKPAKPVKVKVAPAPRRALTNEHVERIEKLEEHIGRILVHQASLANQVNTLESEKRGLQELVVLTTKEVTKLRHAVNRLDLEKVNKVGSPMLEAARRNTLERAEEEPIVTHDITKLGESLARAKERRAKRLVQPKE